MKTASKQNKSMGSRLAGLAAGCLISAIAVIIALFLSEAAYRLLRARETPAQSWTDRPAFYYSEEFAADCRGAVYSPEKAPGVFRIAVLGDSFTFATAMQYDDAFPKKLERMLNLNQTAPRVEVINYGVPGFSTYHEADLLPEVIKDGADLVLVQITLNDPQLKPYLPTGITGRNEFGSYQPAESLQALLEWWTSLGVLLERLHNSQTQRRYIDYYFGLFERPQEWQRFKQSFRRFGRSAKKYNIPIAGVLFPLFGLPLNDHYPFKPLHQKIAELCAANELPILDLYSIYQGIPLPRIQVSPGADFHPNEIGHRLAAEAIYAWLVNARLIPPHSVIQKRFNQRLNTDCSKNEPL